MPTAPIRCLAGDGTGLVWANGGPPGSDLIWVRPVNAQGEITLARNLSGHVWAEGDPILCRWMQTGPGANLLKVIHRERQRAPLYATFNYTVDGSFAATSRRQKIYSVQGGTARDIGRPPTTGDYPPFRSMADQYYNQSMVTWDRRESGAAVVNGTLVKVSGKFRFPAGQQPPGLNILGEIGQGEVSFYTIASYTPGIGWLETAFPFMSGFKHEQGAVSQMTFTWSQNLAVTASGLVFVSFANNSGTIFSPWIRAVWRIDPQSLSALRVLLDSYFFSTNTLADGDAGVYFLADFSQSFLPTAPDAPRLVQGLQTDNGLSPLFGITSIYDAIIGSGNSVRGEPPQVSSDVFRRTALLSSSPYWQDPLDGPEAAWRVGDTCYVSMRSGLWRATGNVQSGFATWQQLWTFPNISVVFGASNFTYGFKELVDEAVFGWFGVSGQIHDISSPSATIRQVIPNSQVSSGGAGNPDNARTYHGPDGGLGTGDQIYTLWKTDATGSVAVWSIAKPLGTQGQPVRMCQHDGRLYVTVGAGVANDLTAAYSNPHLPTGIYEVDPLTLGVKLVIGVPLDLADFPGGNIAGWASIVGDTPAGTIL